nr:hypothetical protein [Streptomyces olivochromogenes]
MDVIGGQGVEEAVARADVVIDLTNSPTFDEACPAYFQTSMDNLWPRPGRAASATASSSRSSTTQFMEFIDAVLSWVAADDDTVRLTATPIHPIVAPGAVRRMLRQSWQRFSTGSS